MKASFFSFFKKKSFSLLLEKEGGREEREREREKNHYRKTIRERERERGGRRKEKKIFLFAEKLFPLQFSRKKKVKQASLWEIGWFMKKKAASNS